MSFISHIKEEFQVIQERDPAIKTPLEVLLYPSFRVMIKYRRAHKLYLKGHYFLARWISQRAARKTGIEIHPGATIGKGLFIDHGSGVIIGETTIIGDNVTLYQGVTLGGNGKETGKRHPDSGRQRYGKRRSKNHRFFHCRSQLQDRSRICCDRGGATELYRSRYSGTCGPSEKYESTENQYGSLSSAGSGAG